MAADLNNTEAMVALSGFYERGEGVQQSHELSVAYLQRAAALGNLKAKILLSSIHPH